MEGVVGVTKLPDSVLTSNSLQALIFLHSIVRLKNEAVNNGQCVGFVLSEFLA